ncbi:hypothetical protein GCM10025779_16950 [Arthrobacter cryoconiti]
MAPLTVPTKRGWHVNAGVSHGVHELKDCWAVRGPRLTDGRANPDNTVCGITALQRDLLIIHSQRLAAFNVIADAGGSMQV